MKYTRYCPSTINKISHPHLAGVTKCWQTEDGKYDILFDEIHGFKHLRILRIDQQPIHSFMDMQEIKNDLWGVDVVAVEVYPRQCDFKNGSNTYHLWTWQSISVPNLAELYKYQEAHPCAERPPQDTAEAGSTAYNSQSPKRGE